MDRRELLGVLGATATGLVVSSSAAHAQHEGHHHRDKAHEDCLKACTACKTSCDEAFHHCYTEVAAGKKEHARALHMVADCAAFCELSATLIARESPLMAHACQACAEACKACAVECGKFDSQAMKDCSKACLDCERTCRAMVKTMAAHST